MDAPPSLETVCLAVSTLYHNPDRAEKDKASKWLQEMQKSIYAWKVSDDLLHQKINDETSYIAAQTMRTKIQTSFHELPKESHNSLKDSILEHFSSIDSQTGSTVITQLCLALADLVLVMPEWPSAVEDLIQKFSRHQPWALLEVLAVLPEEVNSRHLKLGSERYDQVMSQFRNAIPKLTTFLTACLGPKTQCKLSYRAKVFKCFTSWLQLGVISLLDIEFNDVIVLAFKTLSNLEESTVVHEAATDVVCTLLYRLDIEEAAPGELLCLEMTVLAAILKLEPSYLAASAQNDIGRSHNFCRLFTELGETFLLKILNSSNPCNHFALPVLNAVLACCHQPDYEIADITFNLWYRLSEELFRRNHDALTQAFRPYIERLINALCSHCRMESNSEGVLDEGDDLTEFRGRVIDLVKDIVFIAGPANVFHHMLEHLGGADSSWEKIEAALFIMQAVARNIDPMENRSVPQVVEALLGLPSDSHIAVRHVSFDLMGELSLWINKHPDYLERILNWLLFGLQDPLLSCASAIALQNICSDCRAHLWPHFEGLVHIIASIDSFQLKPVAANGLIKGVADILSRMPCDKIEDATKALCDLQSNPLSSLIRRHRTSTASIPIYKNTTSDPVLFLDRLAVIFLNVRPELTREAVHPCQQVASSLWPVMCATFDNFPSDERVMERCCRTLRFLVRCLGIQSVSLMQPIIERIVNIYQIYSHSCFLYLASVLVDEYAKLSDCLPRLLEMLNAFLEPTFSMLKQIDGMRTRPDIVEDFFRLNTRFLQRATLSYLNTPFLPSIIACALQATSLDQPEANTAVLKYFLDLLRAGHTKEDRSDFKDRTSFVNRFKQEYGAKLVNCLVHGAVLTLPSSACDGVGDIIFELMTSQHQIASHWVESSLKLLTDAGSDAPGITAAAPQVAHQQLITFYKAVTTADQPCQTADALYELSRFWR